MGVRTGGLEAQESLRKVLGGESISQKETTTQQMLEELGLLEGQVTKDFSVEAVSPLGEVKDTTRFHPFEDPARKTSEKRVPKTAAAPFQKYGKGVTSMGKPDVRELTAENGNYVSRRFPSR